MDRFPFQRCCGEKKHSEARLKICAAIDKENINDNFLITLRAGGSYSASRVVVVDSAKERRNAHGEKTGKRRG